MFRNRKRKEVARLFERYSLRKKGKVEKIVVSLFYIKIVGESIKTIILYRKERPTIKQIKNGFAEYYYITEEGKVYNKETKKYLKINNKHRYYLRKTKSISLKQLYKMTYNKVFCIDNIQDQENEIWREIENTDQRYFVSNKGRIKSYCKYEAIILKTTITYNGYEMVQIMQSNLVFNKFVHCLVASAFPEDCGKPLGYDWQVHHRNGIKTDNASKNLQWISEVDHIKLHNKGE